MYLYVRLWQVKGGCKRHVQVGRRCNINISCFEFKSGSGSLAIATRQDCLIIPYNIRIFFSRSYTRSIANYSQIQFVTIYQFTKAPINIPLFPIQKPGTGENCLSQHCYLPVLVSFTYIPMSYIYNDVELNTDMVSL